jgi:MFS family permease
VADRVPGAPGDRRGTADPVDDGAGPQLVPPRGAREAPGHLLAAFALYERRVEQPLISIQAFVDNRPFAVDNVLTLFLFFTWLAVFFFGSIYFQVPVGQEPTQAGFSVLTTGAGFGLAMSALNTDALNHAPEEIRGEASGIIQTFRNFGSALGMAILGTIVLGALAPHTTPSGFADALDTAFKVGAVVMAVSFVIARTFMPGGKQADVE